MSKILPNTFQHPNLYIDRLAYYLTAEENVVLDKATREILGWHNKIESRKAPVSLSVFVDGKTKDGERIAHGCGLGIQAIRKALEALDGFRILVKVGKPTSKGQTYWLQDDDEAIDWEGLIRRRDERDEENKKRTVSATRQSLKSRHCVPVTSDVRAKRGNVGRKGTVTSDVRAGVTSDVNKETQKPIEIKNNNDMNNDSYLTTLQDHFLKVSKLQAPSTLVSQQMWDDDLGEIYKLAGQDLALAQDLIDSAITVLDQAKYVVASPHSLLTTCQNEAARRQRVSVTSSDDSGFCSRGLNLDDLQELAGAGEVAMAENGLVVFR